MTNTAVRRPRIGIVLSGYESALTLTSGAMLGFMEKGIEFDVISTSGPGALVGLLALAPRGKSPAQALADLPNLYTGDLLHKLLPFNVRMNTKNSPFAKPMYELSKRLPRFKPAPNDPAAMQRLFNGWMDFAVNVMTPGFEFGTPGLLSHSPLLEEMIDFDELRRATTRFYMATFNLNHKKLEIFDNQTANYQAFCASQSTSLFYPPQSVMTDDHSGGDLFYSGISHDPTGLQAIWLGADEKPAKYGVAAHQLDMVLAFEVITEASWREPTGIGDAFKLMMHNPVVTLESFTQSLYARVDQGIKNAGEEGRRLPKLYRIPVHLGDYPRTEILKWTHSNAIALQRFGQRAASAFADVLLSGDEDALEKHRFWSMDRAKPGDVARLLDTLFNQLEAKKTPLVGFGFPADTDDSSNAGYPRDVPVSVWQKRYTGVGALLGGGAPNMQLVAGALCVFADNKFSFDVISASGAGALPGLLYAAPAVPGSQGEALRESVNIHFSDEIERLIPFNYKVFFKPGPFTKPAWRLGQSLPRFQMRAEERESNDLKRLYNDTLDLMISMMTPTTLSLRSKAMCARVGMLDKTIAWDKLASHPKQFYLNAFDLKTQQLKSFDKTNLTPDTFWAALAMPWLFDPVTTADGATYTEGASHDPSGLGALLLRWDQDGGGPEHPEIRGLTEIVAFETLGADLWTNPETVNEAAQVTIMEPIVTLAELIQVTYGYFEWAVNNKHWHLKVQEIPVPGVEAPLPLQMPQQIQIMPRLYRLPFEIPDWEVRNILRWNYSNAMRLWHIGHASAERFYNARLRGGDAYEEYRYYPSVKDKPRVKELLALFTNYLEILKPNFMVFEHPGYDEQGNPIAGNPQSEAPQPNAPGPNQGTPK